MRNHWLVVYFDFVLSLIVGDETGFYVRESGYDIIVIIFYSLTTSAFPSVLSWSAGFIMPNCKPKNTVKAEQK